MFFVGREEFSYTSNPKLNLISDCIYSRRETSYVLSLLGDLSYIWMEKVLWGRTHSSSRAVSQECLVNSYLIYIGSKCAWLKKEHNELIKMTEMIFSRNDRMSSYQTLLWLHIDCIASINPIFIEPVLFTELFLYALFFKYKNFWSSSPFPPLLIQAMWEVCLRIFANGTVDTDIHDQPTEKISIQRDSPKSFSIPLTSKQPTEKAVHSNSPAKEKL